MARIEITITDQVGAYPVDHPNNFVQIVAYYAPGDEPSNRLRDFLVTADQCIRVMWRTHLLRLIAENKCGCPTCSEEAGIVWPTEIKG